MTVACGVTVGATSTVVRHDLEGKTGSVVAEPLEVGDAVATDLLSALAPLRVEEAHDELERRASYRLRYAAVVERGLASTDAFPDGEEHDEYDDRAVHIVGWDGARPIATCRLVLPRQLRDSPWSRCSDWTWPVRSRWSTLVVRSLSRVGAPVTTGCSWGWWPARGCRCAPVASRCCSPRRRLALWTSLAISGSPSRCWGSRDWCGTRSDMPCWSTVEHLPRAWRNSGEARRPRGSEIRQIKTADRW